MKKSTLLHLRFPFSFFLMPVFIFACAIQQSFAWWQAGLTFVILHFMVYPASNGYNSYFDKDEESIGGLKTPPKVSKELYWASLALDLIALALGFLISPLFVLMLLIYGLVSKAYSHPAVRLKRMPILGWLAAGIFQGYFTFLITIVGLTGFGISDLLDLKLQFAAVLTSLMLFGSYPMTQIYQHGEDSKRGDVTLSLKLGLLGTFHFTAIFFSISTALFFAYFSQFLDVFVGIIFTLGLTPVLIYFSFWYLKARKEPDCIDYDHTMKLNWISSICLNLFFAWLLFS
ncbi:MAG: UbiA prenyltransferase family protein [Cyclobacteriaceae bacterium]